ncbi:PQQ-dependent sugar dehydrogenase [Salinifilum aidingensis]
MRVRFLVLLAVAAALAACGGQPVRQDAGPTPSSPTGELAAEVVAEGLEHPWDIGFLPDGAALVTQRSGELVLLPDPRSRTRPRPVRADFGDVFARNEAGLMGLQPHPDFARNRTFFTCQAAERGGRAHDVRVLRWRLSADRAEARRIGDPLVTGIPLRSNGRHAGCRLELDRTGALLVTTGDSAAPRVSQDRTSLGGKLLRVDPDSGGPARGNPFAGAADPRQRLVLTFGHRNAQGIATRADGGVFLSEHGPDVDDEINRVRPGRNYGWAPRGGLTGYDESVPMTDRERFPNAVPAAWSSGGRTEAICGATFLSGARWGPLDGRLAVAALKGSKLLLFDVTGSGDVRGVHVPRPLDGTFGRLRAVEQGPDGALYVTTSNGSNDRVLRVTPSEL